MRCFACGKLMIFRHSTIVVRGIDYEIKKGICKKCAEAIDNDYDENGERRQDDRNTVDIVNEEI